MRILSALALAVVLSASAQAATTMPVAVTPKPSKARSRPRLLVDGVAGEVGVVMSWRSLQDAFQRLSNIGRNNPTANQVNG